MIKLLKMIILLSGILSTCFAHAHFSGDLCQAGGFFETGCETVTQENICDFYGIDKTSCQTANKQFQQLLTTRSGDKDQIQDTIEAFQDFTLKGKISFETRKKYHDLSNLMLDLWIELEAKAFNKLDLPQL